ncbi:MAG TPA: WbqC family protein [Thermoleophilaceae bacterium]|nr:WbqC family protein [Thermoleophilaceae bacterium]
MATDVVAIHQPNFLPWLGWFDKLARADAMVLLDDVQFPKKGGTPINRVRMLIGGRPSWVTVPIDRSYHGVRTIAEMRIDQSRGWRETTLRSVTQSYSRAPFFESVMPDLTRVIETDTDSLAELNMAGIRWLAEGLGLDTGRLVLSSGLDAEGTGTDRLIELTRAVGGSAYLAGGGAGGYQEDESFGRAGVKLLSQDFEPRPYPQGTDEHQPGLSTVDAVMHVGFEGAAALLSP